MDARLVTSSHRFVVPKVREVAPPAQPATDPRRPATQRDLVAASLLVRPGGAKRV